MVRDTAQRRINEDKVSLFGLIAQCVRLVVGLALTLLLSWGLAVVIEVVGMTFYWPEEGAARSARLLDTEIGYLTGTWHTPSPATHTVLHTTSQLYYWLVIYPGLDTLLNTGTAYGAAIKNVTLILLVRLAILKSVFILYVLGTVWAFNEGLLCRAHRRWSGAIERSSVFHHAKLFLSITILLPIPIYLALNIPVHPMVINGPFLAIYILLIVTTVTFYKKFL